MLHPPKTMSRSGYLHIPIRLCQASTTSKTNWGPNYPQKPRYTAPTTAPTGLLPQDGMEQCNPTSRPWSYQQTPKMSPRRSVLLTLHDTKTNADSPNQVRYANKHNVPFLAVNRGYGSSVDMNRLRRGISIYLHNLDSIIIAADKQSAVLGGGVYAAQLIKTLAKSGKVAGNIASSSNHNP